MQGPKFRLQAGGRSETWEIVRELSSSLWAAGSH